MVETRLGTYQTRVTNVTVTCMSPGRAYRKQIQQYRQFNVHNYEYNFKANVIISLRMYGCGYQSDKSTTFSTDCRLNVRSVTGLRISIEYHRSIHSYIQSVYKRMVRFQKLTRNLFLTLHRQNVHRQQRQLSKFLMRYQQFASHG